MTTDVGYCSEDQTVEEAAQQYVSDQTRCSVQEKRQYAHASPKEALVDSAASPGRK